MTLRTARLGPLLLPSDPETTSITFKAKTADTKALGGKVIQVYGIDLSDLIISGSFPEAFIKSAGRKLESWEMQLAFRDQIDKIATLTETTKNPEPLRFTWPHKGYDFDVFIKDYAAADSWASSDFRVDKTLHTWKLTLFIVSDRTRAITKGLKDLYIKRMMNGVGWKQTSYNGPSEAEVDEILGGKTIADFLADEANKAAQGQFPDTGDVLGFPSMVQGGGQ